MKKIFLFLLFFSLLFADIGPSPEKPRIKITFIKNGDPYIGDVSLVYICAEEGGSESSAIGTRQVQFSCNKGVCENEEWFYKFNPCYYPKKGFFIVKTLDKTYNISHDAQLTSHTYNIVIDLDKGEFHKFYSSFCFSSPFILLTIFGLYLVIK
ncbi:MAG: hypothetical protein QW255_02605 [Candidatus Bilamarchaeaceae archaeon]